MSTTSRRRPFDQLAEAQQPPQPGDAFSQPAARPAPRCRGTRTITAVIPVADAVILDDRLCPGCRDCTPVTDAEHALAEQQLADAVEQARQALAAYDRPEGVEP